MRGTRELSEGSGRWGSMMATTPIADVVGVRGMQQRQQMQR